jgi:hypothetical protein
LLDPAEPAATNDHEVRPDVGRPPGNDLGGIADVDFGLHRNVTQRRSSFVQEPFTLQPRGVLGACVRASRVEGRDHWCRHVEHRQTCTDFAGERASPAEHLARRGRVVDCDQYVREYVHADCPEAICPQA